MKAITKIADLKDGYEELKNDRITVGVATCGISAGADKTLAKLHEAGFSIKIDPVGCAGMCYNEPIVTVMQNGLYSIYGKVTEDKVQLLIDSIKNNSICKELFLGHKLEDIPYYKKQRRIMMDNCGKINPLSLNQYVACGGYNGLTKALRMSPKEVIEEVKIAGLRGRGGAGFPTGQKWEIISKKEGKKYLVCNGDEGDPGAFMNRTIMESDPFRLIEGMTIAAYATGCKEGIIYTRAEYPLAIKTLEEAIDISRKHGILGKNILGEGFEFDIIIKKGAGAFVCGEETALIASIMGKRGNPSFKPPYPAEKGIDNLPTNINNVSTLSLVTSILSMSGVEFAKIGTEKTKGTAVICLTGKILHTGVVEVPMGMTLREIVYDIGGGFVQGRKFKAIQAGGPAGGSISEKELDLTLDFESLNSAGAMMGSGGLVVVDDTACMIDMAKFFMTFTKMESCGKCTPCREGTTRMWEILDRISKGLGTKKDLENLKILANFIKENSLCGLGQAAPNPVLSTLNKFHDEYLEHVDNKRCPSHACKNLLVYTILDNCVGCGHCARVCPVGAITGKLKEKYVIDQNKCVRCGACYDGCAFDAIEKK
ncbi:MAG: NADH-ubiquinone oxidoreductase-F iron-sulfur binding region domain-containing protein [Candidatus Woesearchaeota archaeon]